jgi:hypothetical protein
LKQPECGQCVRSQRECNFGKKHVFIINEFGGHKTKYRKSNSQLNDERVNDEDGSRVPAGSRSPPKYPTESSPHSKRTECAIARPVSTLTPLKQQLLAEANSHTLIQTGNELVPRPWTFTLSAFAGSIHALNSAPLSCYTAWIGRRNNEPYLVEASKRLYIQGLREVQDAVNNPSTALLDETLGACLALIIYEALECPDRSRIGYSYHVDGCARIVKLRGALMHQEGAAHNLFLAFRYIGVSLPTCPCLPLRCDRYTLTAISFPAFE